MPAEFGATPWGMAWVRTVERTGVSAPNPALPKARNLARNAAVALSVEPGLVTAEVAAGGEVRRVRLGLPLWTERERSAADPLRAGVPAAILAAGDLPDELEAELRRDGVGIAVPLEEQRAECDCRARRRPCVHILATVYALAQRIDERPELAVRLRSAEPLSAAPDPGRIPLSDLDASGFYG